MTPQTQNVKGTRDLIGEDAIIREKVIQTLKRVFESYGFQPFFTPVLENAETLKTKISDEMLGLIYEFKDKAGRDIGLRYDLTLGLARVAATQQLQLPFKRYQIERAWRYESPQAGRYREFWQADIDILGQGLEAEAEYLACISEALKALGLKNFVVRVNSRKLLDEIASSCGINAKNAAKVYQLIDKTDKIGVREVEKQLKQLGKPAENFLKTLRSEKIREFSSFAEIKELQQKAEAYGISQLKSQLKFDPLLVRGLGYYTGLVFEIVVAADGNKGKQMQSIAGGGRYDDLVEKLGGRQIAATGISIGLDRVCEILKERQKQGMKDKQSDKTITQVYVIPVTESVREDAIKIAQKLRGGGINTDISFASGKGKLGKALEYANKIGVPYVAFIGEQELKAKGLKLRDMKTGRELLETIDHAIKAIIKKLKKNQI